MKGKNNPSYSHGHSPRTGKSTEYTIWAGIKKRCLNKNDKLYPYYGGRGISVCDRWLEFPNFLEDMGIRPSLNHSIDRIDNNGNYEPNNCRWATRLEQSMNKRNIVKVSFNGESYCLKDFCVKHGVNYKKVWARINVSKWPIDRATGIAGVTLG